MKADFLRISLIILMVLVLCFMLFCVIITSTERDLINDLKHIDRDKNLFEQCLMPGCDNDSDYELFHKMTSYQTRHLGMTIESKAGFMIASGIGEHYSFDDRWGVDKYYTITPNGDGSYDVSKEKEYYEYTKKTLVGPSFTLTAKGTYCAAHVDQAEEILRQELKDVLTSNWLCFIGYTTFPANIVVFLILICAILAIRKRSIDSDSIKPVRKVDVIMPCIFMLIGLGLYWIGVVSLDSTFGLWLLIFGVLLALIFTIAFGTMLGRAVSTSRAGLICFWIIAGLILVLAAAFVVYTFVFK